MAEAFSNSLTRAAGIVTTYAGSTVAAASTVITVTANTGIGVSDLIDNCLAKNYKATINILNENLYSSEDSILITRTFLKR